MEGPGLCLSIALQPSRALRALPHGQGLGSCLVEARVRGRQVEREVDGAGHTGDTVPGTPPLCCVP
jgi:hypothetical protein